MCLRRLSSPLKMLIDVKCFDSHCSFTNVDTVFHFAQTKTSRFPNKRFSPLEFHGRLCAGREQLDSSSLPFLSRRAFSAHFCQPNIINNNRRKSLQSSSVVDYVSIRGKPVKLSVQGSILCVVGGKSC